MNAQMLFAGTVRSVVISIGLLFGIFISQKVQAENYPPDCGLKIDGVPEYLFGGATYATPITFKITGCEKARIISIKGRFKWEGKHKDFDIGSRYGVGDGAEIASESNWGLNYTCFVPASFYKGVLCEVIDQDHRNWDSEFTLSVTFQPFADGKYWDDVTLPSEPRTGKIPKAFADERVFCKEFPAPGSTVEQRTNYTLKEAGGDLVSKEGAKAYYQLNHSELDMEHPFGTEVINGFSDSTTYPAYVLPDNPPPVGLDEILAVTGPEGLGIASFAKVKCGAPRYDLCPPPTYKVTGYGTRIGIYFYVGYGGKVVPPLGVGEPAMDLIKKQGVHSVTLFNGGKTVITKEGVDPASGSILGVISGAAGIGWAITGAAGPFSLAFGLVSSIAALMASEDQDGPSNRKNADGVVTSGFVKVMDGEPPGQALKPTSLTDWLSVSSVNQTCFVGEQYTYFVQTDAIATLNTGEANPVWMFRKVVSAKAAFYAASAGDLNDVMIFSK